MITRAPSAERNDRSEPDLLGKLRAEIAQTGPLPIDRYMARCLYDADHGYYRTRRPFGRDGDYITAPDISQVFGEVLGLWVGVVWQQMGSPARCNLIELGPGRGILMSEMLRALRILPEAGAALRVSLIEISETLRAEQQNTLRNIGTTIDWPDHIADVAAYPTIVIANEYLDALPAQQWIHGGEGVDDWRQRAVGCDEDGGLCFTLTDHAPSDMTRGLAAQFPSALPGEIFETRPIVDDLLALSRFQEAGLVALFIDYGHVRSSIGDTLQAVSKHHAVSPLELPGLADLTTQVDFAAFANAMRQHDWAIDGPILQSELLGSLGIMERTAHLMAGAHGADATKVMQDLESGTQRLMAVQGMGGRFKALALRTPGLPPPPAFDSVASQA